ncbi:MAG: hypothetical protein E7673_02835 [Ruminococcaceae bacterium]|nr:hypothetical protein [Oscillospiraceae bacterium]
MQIDNRKEYLESLLSFAVGGNARSEAEKICERFTSASDIASTDSHLLQNLSGCSEASADFIRLVAAISSRRMTDEFKNGRRYSEKDMERYVIALLFSMTVESVYMISFDKSGKMISTDLLTEGTVNSSAFLPRKMADIALRRKASSVILAHNHPSGNLIPSDNDVAVTLLAKSILSDAHVKLDAHYITVGFEAVNCLLHIEKTTGTQG